MTQGVLKTHGICLMMYFKNNWNANNWNAGPFFLLRGYFRRKKPYIYIDFQTCMNIFIRFIIYSYFYLFKYSTNKQHRKLCIYTHRS